jgi:hypothetical protein
MAEYLATSHPIGRFAYRAFAAPDTISLSNPASVARRPRSAVSLQHLAQPPTMPELFARSFSIVVAFVTSASRPIWPLMHRGW